ncbi:MAG: fasciclin domain-containing protein [Kofleriaceae bacterium]
MTGLPSQRLSPGDGAGNARLAIMANYTGMVVVCALVAACGGKEEAPPASNKSSSPAPIAREPMKVPTDPKNIVSIAVASKDHTTLVAALQAADYVTAVSNPGPLTVFAPTDEAFKKLPAGTVESLVKPENQAKLKEILKYHVTTSVYEAPNLPDGTVLGMANGGKATIHVKDGKISINDANVIASVRGSNGVVHVIDGVLLPPEK